MDFRVSLVFPQGDKLEVGVNVRPYAIELLKHLSRNYEVIVFTASHSSYGKGILDKIDPLNQYIHHRLYRESCHCTPEGIFVKDLRVLNRDPSKVVLIDNAAYSYAFQLGNAIPIIPYYSGKKDQ